MFYNFLKPSKTFENALATEDYSGAVTIAIVTAAIFAVAALLYTNSAYIAFFVGISFVIQWYVLTALLYALEFMMKNRKKRLSDKSFREIATATGQLWTIPLLISVILMAFTVIRNEVTALLAVLCFSILGLLYLHNLYVLVKVTLEAKTSRTIVAWIIILLLHNLIMATTLTLLGIVF